MPPDASPLPDPYARAAAEALRLGRRNARVARDGGSLAPRLRALVEAARAPPSAARAPVK